MVSGDTLVENYSDEDMDALCFASSRPIKRELTTLDDTLLGGHEVISATFGNYEVNGDIPEEAIPLQQGDSLDESRAHTRSYAGRSPRQTYIMTKKRKYISSARKLQVICRAL